MVLLLVVVVVQVQVLVVETVVLLPCCDLCPWFSSDQLLVLCWRVVVLLWDGGMVVETSELSVPSNLWG